MTIVPPQSDPAGRAQLRRLRSSRKNRRPHQSGGFFLSDSKQTLVDGSELSTSPASRLIFPNVTSNVSSANRLVFVNTSSNAISPVTISFFEDSGRLVTQRNIALAAFAGFSGSITDLAPNLRSFDGYAVVETNSAQRALIGLETYRSGNDQALLAAMPEARRLGTGYVPQFGNQTGSISTLVLVNYGSGLQTVKLTAAVPPVCARPGMLRRRKVLQIMFCPLTA